MLRSHLFGQDIVRKKSKENSNIIIHKNSKENSNIIIRKKSKENSNSNTNLSAAILAQINATALIHPEEPGSPEVQWALSCQPARAGRSRSRGRCTLAK